MREARRLHTLTAADANVPWLKVEGYVVEARQSPPYSSGLHGQGFLQARRSGRSARVWVECVRAIGGHNR